MRGQPFQDIFEHFIRESRSGMPDVAQLALVVDAEHQRTEWNVRDSDGTVVFSLAPKLTGGSLKTVEFARKHNRT
jgi:hypothetical protein